MKNKLLITIICISANLLAFSQNRAPSCWLKYQDNYSGDILINTIKVISPSPLYTYYCSLQWNAGMEGGGYCGIQEHPNGRNFIYSIWDPQSSNEPILAEYAHPGTDVEQFGGEGTGLKSWNFSIGWETGLWYSFITRAWNQNSHTMFGYWVYNQTDSIWYHLVTMDYPVPNVRFNSSTGSFIEDWAGNGWNVREVHHKEGWKRKTSNKSWNSFIRSYFDRVSPDAGAINYINNYDGGVKNGYYFMKSGGTTSPITSSSGTNLSLPNTDTIHGFPDGAVEDFSYRIENNDLILSWEVNNSLSPQFSYHIKIYDNPVYIGDPLIDIYRIKPHLREDNINMSSLNKDQKYYFQFYITDIFDNISRSISDSFILEPLSVEDIDIYKSFSVYPNPVINEFNIVLNEIQRQVKVDILNVSGQIISETYYYNVSKISQPFENDSGIYFVRVQLDNWENPITKSIIHHLPAW